MYHSKWAWIVTKALFVEISLCIKVCIVLYLKAFRPSWETPPGPHSACWLLMKTPYYPIIRRRHRWEDCEVSLGRAAIDYWEHCVVCSQDSAQSPSRRQTQPCPEHSTTRRQSTETGYNTALVLTRYFMYVAVILVLTCVAVASQSVLWNIEYEIGGWFGYKRSLMPPNCGLPS